MSNPHIAYLAAVAWANGGTLHSVDLIGANLRRINLSNCDLSNADLIGADLMGADLSGADMRGAEYRNDTMGVRLASAERMDGYIFHLFQVEDGSHKVMAGCRWFTVADYRDHVADEYPNTDKARETLDILDFFERRAGA